MGRKGIYFHIRNVLEAFNINENSFIAFPSGSEFVIGGFLDIGDDTLYIDKFLQSAPVWSCGCRRQSRSVFSCSGRRQSGSVFSCSHRQETPARSIFDFDECETSAREGQRKDVRDVWKHVNIC